MLPLSVGRRVKETTRTANAEDREPKVSERAIALLPTGTLSRHFHRRLHASLCNRYF